MKNSYSVNNNIESEKFKLQDEQYRFPYHYLPHFDSEGYGKIQRSVSKGFEYLCYIKHVKEFIEDISPSSFLEVGCGDGRLIGMLNNDIRKKIGVDLSEKSLRFARAFHPEIEFHLKDANDLDETFDVVAAVEVLEHIPDEYISSFISTLSNTTKNGGVVIVTVPTTVKPLIDKHYRHYDLNLFKKQLNESGAELTIEDANYIYKEDIFLKLYKKISNNKFWYLEFHKLRKLMWRYCWNELRYASENNGHHLVIIMRKKNKTR